MIILALDSCFDACSAALASKTGGILASVCEPMATGHAERLVPMVSEIVANAGLEFNDIDRIAVTYGPGTFTGTRIGVATARAFALALDKELIGETSLAVMAEAIAHDISEGDGSALGEQDILIATDARRDEVYCQLFSASGVRGYGPPSVLAPDEAAAMINPGRPCILAGSGASSIKAAADAAGLQTTTRRPDLLPDAAFLARRIAANRQSAPITDRIAPLYLRPADAKPQSGKAIPRVST